LYRQLTEQQLNQFQTFGFLVFRQLLSRDERKQYSNEFNAAIDHIRRDAETGAPDYHSGLFTKKNTPFTVTLIGVD